MIKSWPEGPYWKRCWSIKYACVCVHHLLIYLAYAWPLKIKIRLLCMFLGLKGLESLCYICILSKGLTTEWKMMVFKFIMFRNNLILTLDWHDIPVICHVRKIISKIIFDTRIESTSLKCFMTTKKTERNKPRGIGWCSVKEIEVRICPIDWLISKSNRNDKAASEAMWRPRVFQPKGKKSN